MGKRRLQESSSLITLHLLGNQECSGGIKWKMKLNLALTLDLLYKVTEAVVWLLRLIAARKNMGLH